MTHRCPQSIPKGRWRELWNDSLAEIGDPSRSDARLLERMVLNLIEADRALKRASEEPYVTGSQGQKVENPGFKVAARCDGAAVSLARQLRLTPHARSNAASSADRETEDPLDALDAEDELAQRRSRRKAA